MSATTTASCERRPREEGESDSRGQRQNLRLAPRAAHRSHLVNKPSASPGYFQWGRVSRLAGLLDRRISAPATTTTPCRTGVSRRSSHTTHTPASSSASSLRVTSRARRRGTTSPYAALAGQVLPTSARPAVVAEVGIGIATGRTEERARRGAPGHRRLAPPAARNRPVDLAAAAAAVRDAFAVALRVLAVRSRTKKAGLDGARLGPARGARAAGVYLAARRGAEVGRVFLPAALCAEQDRVARKPPARSVLADLAVRGAWVADVRHRGRRFLASRYEPSCGLTRRWRSLREGRRSGPSHRRPARCAQSAARGRR